MRSAVVLAILALAGALVPVPPATVERWYSRGIYPVLQYAMTSASSLVPFAVLDLASLVAIAGFAVLLARRWRAQAPAAALRFGAVLLLGTASGVYILFLALWGLNYRRMPLEARLAYDPARVTHATAFQLGETAVGQVNSLEPIKHGSSTQAPRTLEHAFAEAQRYLDGERTALTALPKHSLLAWYFRRAAIDGMTDPIFLEIILNPDVLPIERPFVLAHEWAHLAGYADESEANFLAWLACLRGNAAAQYSGWLAAYRLATTALPREQRLELQRRLSSGAIADLRAIAARLERANPAVSKAARNLYDSYLRANRVGAGIASYDQALRLMVGTAFENGWVPRLRQMEGQVR